MKKLLLTISSIAMISPCLTWAGCDYWDVYEADNRWKNAIDSNIPSDVVDLYAEDGVLLPTFGVTIIDNQEDRLAYFRKLFSEIDELTVHFHGDRHIQFVEGGAVSSGDYTFKGEVRYDGEEVESPARYTFVYEQIHHEDNVGGCHLQLITHHSSEQPFGSKITQLLLQ